MNQQPTKSSFTTPVCALPAQAGIGFRPPHYAQFVAERPVTGFLEVHSENFFGAGGPPLRYLEDVRPDYPLSLHGVALSLGSADGVSDRHLAHLKRLVDRFEPAVVSEHVSWSVTGGTYLDDLLPLPYTEEALDVICRNVDKVQTFLNRPILMENPSAYLAYTHTTIAEPAFISEIVRRTGCGLLLDVNNVYVSTQNLGGDPVAHINAMPLDAVKEIHLAGHSVNDYNGTPIRVDTHSDVVCDAVWALYTHTIRTIGAVPTLIEWDIDIPTLDVLLGEAGKAQSIMDAEATCGRPSSSVAG